MDLGRASAIAALAVSLVLSLLPSGAPQVSADTPEAVREATTASLEDIFADPQSVAAGPNAESNLEPTKSQFMSIPSTEDSLGENTPPVDQTSSNASSVRPRGLEAPVELEQELDPQEGQGADRKQNDQGIDLEQVEQEENKNRDLPRDEKRDAGDGPVRKRDGAQAEDRAQQGIRIWPMPADSYTFTQQFGCVPQLGNLYFSGEGCPPEAPVIHTGVDLAAPEGTLFYAAASGWVTLADYDRPTADANTRIIIQHDGRNERYATDYLHWIASYVEEGDYVDAGDPIGEVGSVGFSTGPHLHFSVTDLDTGEHIDPLRWLPEEAGLEGYVSRRPTAQLRLPAGTTAGQPESADPAPPAPPVREDVPKDPPDESGGRERSEQRDERDGEKRPAKTRDGSATDTSDRSGKKGSRDDEASSEGSDESEGEKTSERNRSRERERIRERNKDGSQSEADDSGEVERNSDNGDDSKSENQRRDPSGGSDPGDKEKREDDSDGRDRGDDEGQNSAGGRDQRDDERQDQDRDSTGKDDQDSGGGKDRGRTANPDGEASSNDGKSGGGAGDSGNDQGGGDRDKRDKSANGDAVVAPPATNDSPERNNRDRRKKS